MDPEREKNAASSTTYLGFENSDFETLNTTEREKEKEKKRAKKGTLSRLFSSHTETEKKTEKKTKTKSSLSACGIIIARGESETKRDYQSARTPTTIRGIKVFILEREFWNAFCGRETSRTQS